MENREFIAANELPEIEAETVDVLCVDPETGEMGKKSGAALGGSEEYDVVLNAVTEQVAGSSLPVTTWTLVHGDYETVKTKILEGKPVRAVATEDDRTERRIYVHISVSASFSNDELAVRFYFGELSACMIRENNKVG